MPEANDFGSKGGPVYGWDCICNKKDMFSVYVLRSLKNNKRYIGYTSKAALERLHDHNTGSNKWTRENDPFSIIRSEEFADKKEAMQREKFLKSGQGGRWLDENTLK